MAKSLKDIKLEMTTKFVSYNVVKTLYGLTEGKTFEDEFSLVSFENILFDVIAYPIYLMGLLFDQHEKEMTEKLRDQKRGRLTWYRTMALQYQHGFDLVTDSDIFDNTGATQDQITASMIIKNASVNDGEKPGTIVVKIAGEENEELAPVPLDTIPSIKAYFKEIKFGGNRISVVNSLPDILYLDYDIYINPLVLDVYGVSSKTGRKPVEDAIEEFKREFSFDGELVLEDLDNKIQAVEGVEIAHRKLVRSSYIVPEINGYGPPQEIEVKKVLESGYFATPDFNGINYVV
ncbi:hypothetical protein FHR24_001508 [Wenyingzhuangia heitensis]|uniref:Baseplate J-like protein n=1 Tax=Wenyingzhuangia heitensis TaxID=1487859 RepID=A0ABX0U9N5_9FLAO|nr:nucleotidyltransferase [Wenyingzhuangia heitensis]NIJ45069.1 hypothetical protein [Wenyingzhuangia heitensis]